MAIYYTGNASAVANIKQTPGAITDTFANRPAATAVTQYTLFFASDTGAIYQSTGASWVQMGGGGGSQTLQQVLTTGSTLTQTNIINNAGYDLAINNFSAGNYNTYYQQGNTSITIASQNLITNNGLFCAFQPAGLLINIISDNNFGFNILENINTVQIGNTGNKLAVFTPFIEIDSINKTAQIGNGDAGGILNGLFFSGDTSASVYLKLGDINNVITGTFLNIDVTAGRISTEYSTINKGIDLDFSAQIYIFGDQTGAEDYLQINHTAHTVDIWTFGVLQFTYDDRLYFQQNPTSANSITQTTHGGASGNYLKVTVDGVDYVIELRNP